MARRPRGDRASEAEAPAISRRRWIYAAGGGIAAIAAGYPIMQAFSEEPRAPWRRGPFGDLRRDPARVIDLPEGFSYRVLQRQGAIMSDGLRVPARPDGMACFALPDGSLALLRNHENPAGMRMLGPWTGEVAPEAYAREAMGGVTRVVLDPVRLEVRSSNLVLGGTVMNCAGGPSPWGWLSAEETFAPRHGLVFACDPAADRIAAARPIPGYGKFRHEAVAVDPETHVAWLTEDWGDGCLYRFVPHDRSGDPFDGELQAMAIRGRPGMDTSRGLAAGDRLEVSWVRVANPAPERDVIRHHARREGAASVCRGEGICWDPSTRSVIVTASAGGPHETGQIFRLEPDGDGGELVLLAQSQGTRDFDMPDNVVVSPQGTLFFCEDGHDRNYVRGLDAEGRVFDFARNAVSRSEIAGLCFSPDGRAMFLNFQLDGLTLAITGPFA